MRVFLAGVLLAASIAGSVALRAHGAIRDVFTTPTKEERLLLRMELRLAGVRYGPIQSVTCAGVGTASTGGGGAAYSRFICVQRFANADRLAETRIANTTSTVKLEWFRWL